eukprot:11183923-Lingulodinium_polyedra.AAC.1
MMRSNRLYTFAAARKSHASRAPCEHQTWCSRGVCDACDLSAGVPAHGRFNHIIVQRFTNVAQ